MRGFDATFKFEQVPADDHSGRLGLVNIQAQRLLTFVVKSGEGVVGSKAVDVFDGMTVDASDAFTLFAVGNSAVVSYHMRFDGENSLGRWLRVNGFTDAIDASGGDVCEPDFMPFHWQWERLSQAGLWKLRDV